VIRIVTDHQQSLDLYEWIESLRYAGLVVIHRNDNDGMCFDVLPPHGVVSAQWAQANAERMQTFGINAVAAPEWADHRLIMGCPQCKSTDVVASKSGLSCSKCGHVELDPVDESKKDPADKRIGMAVTGGMAAIVATVKTLCAAHQHNEDSHWPICAAVADQYDLWAQNDQTFPMWLSYIVSGHLRNNDL